MIEPSTPSEIHYQIPTAHQRQDEMRKCATINAIISLKEFIDFESLTPEEREYVNNLFTLIDREIK